MGIPDQRSKNLLILGSTYNIDNATIEVAIPQLRSQAKTKLVGKYRLMGTIANVTKNVVTAPMMMANFMFERCTTNPPLSWSALLPQ
jgi:hypothetical protein